MAMSEQIEGCPQPETPIRERAWADGQRPEPKYSVEEVRARFEKWAMPEFGPDLPLNRKPDGDYLAWEMQCVWSAYQAAYAERIEADEGAAPMGWLAADGSGRVIDEKAKDAGNRSAATGSATAVYSIPLFAHPPAQATQDDWRIGFFERWRKAAHEKGYAGVAEAIMAAPPDFLRGTTPAPAPSINLAAVREVIASHIEEAKKLRHDPESQNYLYEQADKLEAAIKGVE